MSIDNSKQAAPVVASEGSKLDHECEFLQDWLQTAAEPCGRECCGHGVGGECCGDAEPVFMTYPEFLEAMQARLKEVTALLSSQPSPAPVAMTDEKERELFEQSERESELSMDSDGDYANPCVQSAWEGWKARAILAAQQPAAAPSNPLGMASCGKPLCSDADHHPLCSAGANGGTHV